jgi:hypothetical protein
MIDNTTYRILVEKLGGSQANEFTGDEGELFYDPNIPELKLSDGSTVGGLTIAGGGGDVNLDSNDNFIVGDGSHSGTNNIFIGVGAGSSNTTGCYNNFFGYKSGYSNTTGSFNNFLGGYKSGYSNTIGSDNTFLGYCSGYSNTTGCYNIFFGEYAGVGNTSGSYNNFFGHCAGYHNTTGEYNVFIGEDTGKFNTTGDYNNFIGENAGNCNTTGLSNNFFGYSAGYRNTTGRYNQAYGNSAGACNRTGGYNNFFGNYTGLSTAASYKVILGTGLYSPRRYFDSPDTKKDKQFAVGINTTGTSEYWLVGNENFNIGIGTTNPQTKLEINGVLGFGTFIVVNDYLGTNIKIGDNTTGASITDGHNNIFMGIGAGQYNTTGYGNNFSGTFAGQYNTTGFSNNFLGAGAGRHNTTGIFNNFLGGSAGYYNTTGKYNSFFGNFTGISTSASNKIILGNGNIGSTFDSPDTTKDKQFAVGLNTTGTAEYWLVGDENFNIGIGTTNPQTKLEINGVLGFGTFTIADVAPGTNIRIGDNTTGSNLTDGHNNIFMGIGAGNSTTTGCYNNFLGKYAGLSNTTGSSNNFLGFLAGYNNTTGGSNAFFGVGAGNCNTTGSRNTFFGEYAGLSNTTGSFNNFLGRSAGRSNTTGDNNTFLGKYSGLSTSASNKIILGSGAGGNIFDSPDTTKDKQFAVGIKTTGTSEYWLVGNENFNIGIGTTNPTTKLQVDGDVKVGINTTQGVILTSTNGTAYRLIVDDSGALSTVAV